MYINTYSSPLGEILLISDGTQLSGLYFHDQKNLPIYADFIPGDLAVFTQAKCWLDIYFCGKNPQFLPLISAEGTPFQKEVWRILLTIPYGRTVSYGEIAAHIAKQRNIKKMAAQAVGIAVSRNPLNIIIPCHRVIGADGSLNAYAGGAERKQKLLLLEKYGWHNE